jgi:hypothetical protein
LNLLAKASALSSIWLEAERVSPRYQRIVIGTASAEAVAVAVGDAVGGVDEPHPQASTAIATMAGQTDTDRPERALNLSNTATLPAADGATPAPGRQYAGHALQALASGPSADATGFEPGLHRRPAAARDRLYDLEGAPVLGLDLEPLEGDHLVASLRRQFAQASGAQK